MIRRFNFTDRIRIRRKDIRITLREEKGKFAFDADLSALVDYELPPESFVFVEAYRQTNWMRFDFGQVGAITPTADRYLSQFDSPDGIKFRVKVTPDGDIHTLLAEADAIQLARPDQQEGERTPLLPVKPQKLGDEIYRLDFSGQDGRPLLLINSDAGNYADIGRSPAFVSLVYPSVLREILIRVLLIEKHDDDANPNDWQSQWVRFASLHAGLGDLPPTDDVDERGQWIEKAVSAFAKQLQARAKFAEFWKGVL
jgi:hypothetical protein